MADIFVSYARVDKPRVAPLVGALEAQGWSVWWDPAISAGQEFDRLISAELEAARAVVAVWTPYSVESRWVRGEAREAAGRGILIPVRFESARLPLDVRALHTTDLDDWNEDSQSPQFCELARAIHSLLSAPSRNASEVPTEHTTRVPPQVRMRMPPADNLTSQGATALRAQPPPWLRAHRALVIGISLAILLIGSALFLSTRRHPAAIESSVATASTVRVAVLPFDVLSDSHDLRDFAGGLTDEIIDTLSNNQVQTVSREDSVALRSTDPSAAMSRIGANLLFDGTVEQNGGNVHVRVHLDAPAEHVTLWSGDFTRAAKDSRTLQTEVATRAGGLIQLALYAKSVGSAPIDDDTLALALKVSDDLRNDTPNEREVSVQAVELGRRVIARAPGFAWGHSLLANALEANAFLVPTTAEENARQLQEAKNQAERALALYPKDAMAYFALSALASGPTAYESAVLKGLAADPHPTFFVGGLYGREGDLLRTMGRLNEALTNWRRAVALDPLSSWERARMSATLAQLGDMSEAKNVIEQALALWPNDREVRITNLMILVFGDSPKEASAFLDDSSKLPPALSVDAIGAYRAFVAAREAPTGELKAELKAKAFSVILSALDAGMLDSTVAAVMYAQLGDIDAAFAATRKSPPPNRQILSWLFSAAATKMRADPRFMPLAARLGLVDYWQSTGKWPDFCTASNAPYDCKAEARKFASMRVKER